MSPETLFPLLVVGVTTALLLRWPRGRVAAEWAAPAGLLEWAGLAMLLFAANEGLGVALALVGRALGLEVSPYLVADSSVLVFSGLQAQLLLTRLAARARARDEAGS